MAEARPQRRAPARRAGWRAGIAAALALLVPQARADEAAAWTALHDGGVVALMRHADAPGFADPPGFRVDDCATQRNLSARGRADAQAAGRRWRAERVTFARVLASPWCRCVDTAMLLDAGPVQREPTLGNVVVLADQRERLTDGARRLVGAWRGPGNLLVVTHGANIQALLGGPNPSSGETVVVRPRADGTLEELGRIAPAAR